MNDPMATGRIDLAELEDCDWVPRRVRDGGTDLLDVMFDRIGFYKPLAPMLARLVRDTGRTHLDDVCSGGGGGVLSMRRELRNHGVTGLRLSLSDLHPNAAAMRRLRRADDSTVAYAPLAVDALTAPVPRDAIRTQFGALHHFDPAQIQRLVTAATTTGAPVAFFDVAAVADLRRVPRWLLPLVALPNLVLLFAVALLLTPLMRPFSWRRLLLTYLVPLIPLLYAWDGTASALRAYAPEEVLAIARSSRGASAYTWSCERAGRGMALIGRPPAA